MERRPWLRAAAALALATAASGASAQADDYPSRAVRLVVGFPPGGTNDILARLLAAKLQERFGQSFVVENKPGANAIISAEYVAKQGKPDGYTLLVAASGALTVNPALYAKLPYDPVRDFTPVAMLGSFPLVVVTHPSLPVASVQELVALARQRTLDYGAGSSTFQLAAELLASQAGVTFNHVPYKGSAATVAAVMADEVKFTIVDSPPVVPALQAGKVKALAVSTPRRSPAFPDLPTVAESGLPDYDATIWTSLVAPQGTPAAVVGKLQSALAEIFRQPDVRERYASLGLELGGVDGSALERTIAADIAKWTALARKANIKAE